MLRETSTKFQLPIPLDKLVSVDTHSSPAHAGRLENAVDFAASENTIVLVRRTPGIVTLH